MKVEYTEEWDPSFGYKDSKVKKTSYREIPVWSILVKDGRFGGLVEYYGREPNDFSEFYFECVLLPDYEGADLLLGESSGYGSSDMDMMWTSKTYLSKKEAQ